MNPADALFDFHGIPGQVIVDHLVAKLKVASLAADFRGEQNIGLFLELLYLCILFRVFHLTVKHRMGYLFPGQVLGYMGMQTQTALKWMHDGNDEKADSLLRRLVEVAKDYYFSLRQLLHHIVH